MRFHAALIHTPETCPGPRGGSPVPDWPARAKEVGVELISAVVCHPAHTQFFVIETDDYSKLRAGRVYLTIQNPPLAES